MKLATIIKFTQSKISRVAFSFAFIFGFFIFNAGQAHALFASVGFGSCGDINNYSFTSQLCNYGQNFSVGQLVGALNNFYSGSGITYRSGTGIPAAIAHANGLGYIDGYSVGDCQTVASSNESISTTVACEVACTNASGQGMSYALIGKDDFLATYCPSGGPGGPTGPPPGSTDFSLTLDPHTVSMRQGEVINYTVSFQDNFSGSYPVQLDELDPCPTNATCGFWTGSGFLGNSITSNMIGGNSPLIYYRIQTTAGTPIGVYPITVNATDMGSGYSMGTRTDNASLSVLGPSCNAQGGTNQLLGCGYLGGSYQNPPLIPLGSATPGPVGTPPVDNFVALDQNYGNGEVIPGSNVPDNLYVIWSGDFNFSGGTYYFTARTHGSNFLSLPNVENVYVDGAQFPSITADGLHAGKTVSINLTPGTHNIMVTYQVVYQDYSNYNAVGAAKSIHLDWTTNGGNITGSPAVCDGNWHNDPSGQQTSAQPVGVFLPSGVNAHTPNQTPLESIGVAAFGLNSEYFAASCVFPASGNICYWTGWQDLQGIYGPSGPLGTPDLYTFFDGSKWQLRVRTSDNNVLKSNATLSSTSYTGFFGGWAFDGGSYPFRTPTSFSDSRGNNWQLRQGPGNAVQYSCTPPRPHIVLNPTNIPFSGISGSSTPAAQNMTISDSVAGSTLQWRAQTDQNWCRVNGVNNSGSITGSSPYGSPATVSVSVDAPSSVSTFNCTITVSDNGSSPAADNSPQTAAVVYTVSAGTCPNPGTVPVNLSASTIQVGGTALASAPANFTGGSFSPDGSGHASVSGSTVTGVSPGNDLISGSGWTYTVNGASACSLGGTLLHVNNAHVNGVCGNANGKTYPNGASSYGSDQQCSAGSSSNASFPSAGNSVNWTCLGANGGSNSGTCSASQASASCTTLTYKPATSGFSINSAGPAASSLSVNTGDTFYAFVDYGSAGVNSIQPPAASGAPACTFDTFVGTAARFICTAASTPAGYTYTTGTTAGTSSNTCASGPTTIGTVTVSAPSGPTPPGPGPTYNSNTDPAAPGPSAASCGQVRITWVDNSTNETGFKIYKDGSFTGTIVSSTSVGGTGTVYTYKYDTGNDIASHVFSVVATGPSGDSSVTDLPAIAGIACRADLSGSDKEITAVNSASVSTVSPCDGKPNLLPSTVALKTGDMITFSINLCNSGNNTAGNITITDELTNLSSSTAAKYCDGGTCTNLTPGAGVGHYSVVGGTPPNEIIKFNLSSASFNVSPSTVKNLIFTAKIDPGSSTANYSRFQNSADICFSRFPGDTGSCNGFGGSQSVRTNLLLFYNGSNLPDKQEVAP